MDDESDDKDDTKRKSRNLSEKKRRDQFNSLVCDLSTLISTSGRKMDKSTVLKSTISFLRNHNEAADRSKVFEIQQDWKPTFLSNDEFTHLMLESLDGFMIVFGSMGTIFYASESITSQLGYLPQDLYSMNIYDLAYEIDHEALMNVFVNPPPVIEPRQTDIGASNEITFYTHLKRGGVEKVDSNSYELVKFVGYFRNDPNTSAGSRSASPSGSQSAPVLPHIFQKNPSVEVDRKLVFVGTGRIQNPQLIREMSIIDPTSNEFTSKHSMEWKFLFLDHRAPPIIGYMPFEVLGTSGYDYYHVDDLDSIVACHEELRQTGEGKSCYYRFLTKGQQWIWLQTDYFVSYHQFNTKPDYVVCTHNVVSYAEVIKHTQKEKQKASSKDSTALASTASSSKSATATTTLRDFELGNENLESTLLDNSLANLTSETAANSPTVDASPMWSASVAAAAAAASGSCQVNPLKIARPASSYGNISSTGISPKAKRKCYFYNNRGNDSDSTSMSTESVTSRQSVASRQSGASRHSMMTHASSQSQRQRSQHRDHSQSHNNNNHHQQQQAQQQQQQQHLQHLQQQQQQIQQQLQLNVGPPKLVPMLPIAPAQIVAGNAFPQPAYPLASPQLVAPTFLEPHQYLTAIPMQPVIGPFPVPPVPVLSPLAVSGQGQGQQELLPGSVVMTPTQSQLQDQLQRKHDELQKLIVQQQDELRIVSEQLLLARYTYFQPVVQMGLAQGSMAPGTAMSSAAGGSVQRGFNFAGTNAVQPQFNQYGFALNSEQMLNQQDQQMMMQQQQNLHNQQQHNLQQQHQSQNQLQQQQHMLQQQQLQLQHQQQQQQQNDMLSREDIEDIDAFLNLSPLQSLEPPSSTLNTSHNNSHPSFNNGNGSTQNNTNTGHNTGHNTSHNTGHNNNNNSSSTAPQNHNEDSLLSYMQMATSPSVNFHMGISDDGSETHSEDKMMMGRSSNHLQLQQQHLLQQQQQQHQQQMQQSSNFYHTNPFLTHLQNQTQNQLPNDLEILPFQMSQEQSQNLFDAPNTAHGGSQ
ncbi:circadian locomoter output cycles protein kaput isoform X2 [Drosophila obscura]|uniref:circadian locomoter output cycles protein kaput isoform X2 n=1 Tax=Drosophila obscura TaxID=7282 RepID=UPI001BB1888C|nr:circadian locomoter output cycles protein kaput isoform X2 [Drosophila obscura]